MLPLTLATPDGAQLAARLIRPEGERPLRVRPCPRLTEATLAATDPVGCFNGAEQGAFQSGGDGLGQRSEAGLAGQRAQTVQIQAGLRETVRHGVQAAAHQAPARQPPPAPPPDPAQALRPPR